LVVTDLALYQGQLVVGQTPTFRATVLNSSAGVASGVQIKYVQDGTEFLGGHNPIPAGTSDTHDHIWQGGLTAGQHSLTFIVDPFNKIAETDESNNQKVLT